MIQSPCDATPWESGLFVMLGYQNMFPVSQAHPLKANWFRWMWGGGFKKGSEIPWIMGSTYWIILENNPSYFHLWSFFTLCPLYSWLSHSISNFMEDSFLNQITISKLQIWKIYKKFNFFNFAKNLETWHATHLLKLLNKMCKYKLDPASIVEVTEQTWFCPQTDGRTDGWTDGHRPREGRGYKNVSVTNVYLIHKIWFGEVIFYLIHKNWFGEVIFILLVVFWTYIYIIYIYKTLFEIFTSSVTLMNHIMNHAYYPEPYEVQLQISPDDLSNPDILKGYQCHPQSSTFLR